MGRLPFGLYFFFCPLSTKRDPSHYTSSTCLVLWMFVDVPSGWTMRGSKLLDQTELQQSGCWDVVPKWGFKVSNAGITTTTDCQLGLWADTRSRGLTPLNPASCTEALTTWVSVTAWRILCSCPCELSRSHFHFPPCGHGFNTTKALQPHTQWRCNGHYTPENQING